MRTNLGWLIGASFFALVGHAQVPAGNDTSDNSGNTGSGTGALGSPSPYSSTQNSTAFGYQALYSIAKLGSNPDVGTNNTAVGTVALFSNTTGSNNTAVGESALNLNTIGISNLAAGSGALTFNTSGSYNAAAGAYALFNNGTGSNNTAFGYRALSSSTTASNNTAVGGGALIANTSGANNTAVGAAALTSTTTGGDNSALGLNALYSNLSGSYNTAVGDDALYTNSNGDKNTAIGTNVLYHNISGGENTASGFESLVSNTTGTNNTASGYEALYSNMGGVNNTAIGAGALYSNVTGGSNLALGVNSGYKLTGSNNIDLGVRGVAGESGVIRIGTPGAQVETYISGIENQHVTGAAVYVTSSGQLGVLASSERYKTAIVPMATTTEKLQQLRPVRFHLKADPQGAVQYGLIAEEVDKVYPELVIRDSDGNIQGVRYDELAPMLLNELQRERRESRAIFDGVQDREAANLRQLATQADEIRDLKRQLKDLNDFKREMLAVLGDGSAANLPPLNASADVRMLRR